MQAVQAFAHQLGTIVDVSLGTGGADQRNLRVIKPQPPIDRGHLGRPRRGLGNTNFVGQPSSINAAQGVVTVTEELDREWVAKPNETFFLARVMSHSLPCLAKSGMAASTANSSIGNSVGVRVSNRPSKR